MKDTLISKKAVLLLLTNLQKELREDSKNSKGKVIYVPSLNKIYIGDVITKIKAMETK